MATPAAMLTPVCACTALEAQTATVANTTIVVHFVISPALRIAAYSPIDSKSYLHQEHSALSVIWVI